MLEPFAPCHWRWSPTALVLLAVTACGGRTSGTVVSASGAEMSSGTLEPGGGADTSVPDASATVDATPGQDSSADAGTPPSCAPGGPGMSDCGAASESCCTSLEVTGGTYYRTYSWDPNVGPAGEADPATVSSFRLDKYLVTVGRFRQFVNAWNGGAGYTPPAGSGKHVHLNGGLGLVNVGDDAGLAYEPGWVATDDVNVAPTSTNLNCIGANDYPTATWTPSASTQENLPINCVNWYEAYAFCIWDDGFLPSEAEWEYAAAGGNQQREFPWGSTAPGGTAYQYAIYNCDYPSGSAGSCTGVTNIAPVGTAMLGAGFWGQLDLAGNGGEWALDWDASYIDPCTDCADLTPSPFSGRVFRGASFGGYPASVLLVPTRDSNPPTIRLNWDMFRCARTP
jgi:sulfatase modifying factor 1